METKVRGLKVFIDEKNIKIMNSYQIKKRKKMKIIIETILEKRKEKYYKTNKTIHYYILKWKIMNILYSLHIFRKITSNCKFNA